MPDILVTPSHNHSRSYRFHDPELAEMARVATDLRATNTLRRILVHGPRGSWDLIESVGFTGIADFPGYPITYTGCALIPGATYTAAAAGDYDSHWYVAGNKIANTYGHPDAWIRPYHEFNISYVGEWYAGPGSGVTPAQYRAAFRRYVQVMRTVPGQNFKFDWTYLMGDALSVFTEGWYPGDDVVDAIGMDNYNRNYSSDLNARWSHLLDHYNGLNALATFADVHGKYIAFGEWMNANYPSDGTASSGDDTVFAHNMVAWIASNNVIYHTPYFDDNDGGHTDFPEFPNTYNILWAAYHR